jgi:SAM-dependent methyltransferase
MKIAYVGNFTQKHCTECHLALTLEMLGHEVIRIQEDNPQESLDNIIIAGGFDLFLFTRTWGNLVEPEHLEMLKERGIPTVSYHLDLYVGLTRKYLHHGKNIEEVFKTDPFWRTDYVFTPDGDEEHAKVFKANGVNHYYMKPGVFESECYLDPRQTNIKPHHEVLFVGGGDRIGSPHIYGHPEWNYRNELITWLYDTYGGRFTKFGHPQETIRNERLNQLYADTKVVVGDSVCLNNFTQTHYWSDRVYETIGRGGFLIHPYINGLNEEFTGDENIVFYEYGDFDQLKEKIDYYLEHDAEREKIRSAGQKFVKENCTYTHRLKQMLEIVKPKSTELEIVYVQKINFGSGDAPLEGHINVDMLKRDDVDVVHNLMDFPYPFKDNSTTHIKAVDVLEHLANYTDDKRPTIIAFLEECHRILKTGGELYLQVPSWNTEIFEIDVTHVRGFHEKSFDFLDPDTWYGEIRGFYTKAKFKIEKKEKFENGVMRFWLIKL